MSGRTRFALPALWLLLLAAPGARPAALQQKYRLREVAAVGDQYEQTAQMNMAMKAKVSAAGQKMEFEMSGRQNEKYREEVLAVNPQGEPTAIRRTYSVKQESVKEPTGEQKEKASSLQGKTIELRRRGEKTVVTVLRGKIDPEDQKEIQDDLDTNSSQLFPDRELALGEEWAVDPKVVSQIFREIRSGSVKGQLVDVVEREGRPCARARLTMTLTGQAEGMPVPLTLNVAGDIYHALDLKRWIAVDLSGPISMKGEISEGGVMVSFSGEGTMQMKATARWLKVDGKAVPAAK